MIIHPAAQGTLEWMQARAGIPTASEFDQLLTPKFEIRTGLMPKTYLYKKLAEWWQGGPLPGFSSVDMEFGNILEERAKPWFELETGLSIQNVGLCLTDDELVGCSPDGLIGEDGGVEIKCPARHTHVGYLLYGALPPEYACQVHGSMWVTGRPWWYFVSYDPGLPKLVVRVDRDDEICERIGEAIAEFLERMAFCRAKLTDINGGPPARKMPQIPPKPFVSEMPS